MSPLPRSAPDPWTRRAQAFWQARQRRALPGRPTGYLLDESPASIGQHRFEGEWSQVKAWLDARGGARGRCLDVGCGTGLWLRALAGVFEQVEGWDYAPAMIQASRRTLKAAGVENASLQVGQVQRRAGRAAFDAIFVGGVLMYTPDQSLGPLLKSLARLLKPGGLLILRESTLRGQTWLREGLPLRPGLLADGAQAQDGLDYVAVYRDEATLRQALQAAGLRVEARHPNPHYKLSDLTEDWLRAFDRLLGGRLRRDPALAERLAAGLYAERAFLLYPFYFVRQVLRLWPWKLRNDWFLCVRPR